MRKLLSADDERIYQSKKATTRRIKREALTIKDFRSRESFSRKQAIRDYVYLKSLDSFPDTDNL